MAASALFLLYEKQCEEKSLGKNHEKSPRLVYPWNNYSNLEFSSYVTSFWNVLCIYTYFSSFLKTMLTDDSVSPEFNKISHWFLLCTFETSWQIAASALLSGIFETFDKIMTKIDRYRSPNQESTFDLNSKLDKIIEIEYKLLSPWIFKLCH